MTIEEIETKSLTADQGRLHSSRQGRKVDLRDRAIQVEDRQEVALRPVVVSLTEDVNYLGATNTLRPEGTTSTFLGGIEHLEGVDDDPVVAVIQMMTIRVTIIIQTIDFVQ